MRRVTLILVGLAANLSLGCHLAGHSQPSQARSGQAHVSCSNCTSGQWENSCSANGCRRAGGTGFGLFGKIFCDQRLSDGTACWPWQYSYNLCLATSQLSNTVLGGDPDESLSSRFGRAQEDGVWAAKYGMAPVTNVLVGPDHCRRCIEYDEPRNKELWAW